MNARQQKVIESATRHHARLWTQTSDVSRQTKSAIRVCKTWQQAVMKEFGGEFTAEYRVREDGNERIDLVDSKGRTAYELKVSKNNVHFEFYRDVFKVLVFNLGHPRNRLKKLIFVTPNEGAKKLDKPFANEVRAIARRAGVQVEIAPI
jgi:hypothetical protein